MYVCDALRASLFLGHVVMASVSVMALASASCSVKLLHGSLLMNPTHSHAQSWRADTFSSSNWLYARLAPCPKIHSPNRWMPLKQTAHTIEAGFRHCLQIADSCIVPWILYPRHLWHLTRPFVEDPLVIMGHVHSRWKIFLAVVQLGRPLPKSGMGVVCCGNVIAARILLPLALFGNVTTS